MALLVVVLLAAWLWASTPQLSAFAAIGVPRHGAELVEVAGVETTLFVLPNDAGVESTIMFDVVNHGPVPLTVVDVWPEQDGVCFWSPTRREIRQEQDDLWHDGLPAAPARGAVIPPGEAASFWLTGSMPDDCQVGALLTRDAVDVVVQALGRTTTVPITPMGGAFAVADDPERTVESLRPRIVPPTE